MGGPYLYHGTSTKHLRAILRGGLQPRGSRKSLWKENPSRPDHVYLTDAYPLHFAKNAATGGSRLLVLRIDRACLEANLYADEDALAQFNRAQDRDRFPSLEEATAFYRDAWDVLAAARSWQSSLGFLGTCSHHGVIPPEAISGVLVCDSVCWLSIMADPTISFTNYRLLGPYYRALSAYPFEGEGVFAREMGNADEVAKSVSARYAEEFLSKVRVAKDERWDWKTWERPQGDWKPAVTRVAAYAERVKERAKLST